jgi:hypothetical protein
MPRNHHPSLLLIARRQREVVEAWSVLVLGYCEEWHDTLWRKFGAMSGADGASNFTHPWAGNLISISLVNGRNMGHSHQGLNSWDQNDSF